MISIPYHNNIMNVNHVRQENSFACVTCTIPNYVDVSKNIEIGQHITTTESFDLTFPDFASQWMLIYYPKGQYDFGVASGNCRVYVKMLSCDKSEILRMNIKVAIQSSSHCLRSYTRKDASEFILNDSYKSWAGPFEIETMKGIKLKDNLTIKCLFEIITNEDNDKFSSKRSLSEVNYPISSNEPTAVTKKTRSVSPEVENKDIAEKRLSGKEESSFKKPSRSSIFSSEERDERKEKCKPNADVDSKNIAVKNLTLSVHERISKFKYKEPPRRLIFSPEERCEVREKYNPAPAPSNRLSLRRKTEYIVSNFFNLKTSRTPSSNKLPLQEENIEPKTFKSSQCLKVSDITTNDGMAEEDKQMGDTDNGEMNTSETNSEALERRQDQSLNRRISFFENLNKVKE